MSVATNGPMGGLGRVRVEDARDAGYLARDVMADRQQDRAPLPKRKRWSGKRLPLNQGDSPMCVGFSTRGLLYSGPVVNLGGPTAQEIYAGAQANDGIRGPHDGSNARGAMKYLKSLGYIGAYVWATDMATVERWLLLNGPLLFGTNWYSPFDEAPYGLITATQYTLSLTPDATVRGGHELELIGVDAEKRLIEIPNTWGKGYGHNGRVLMPYDVFERLLHEGGDACTPSEILVKGTNP